MSKLQIFSNGLLKENPTVSLILGMCPTLGVTTSLENGLGMGAATLFVLVMSNMAVSAVGSQIPDKVRIPAYVVIIATFVTLVELLMKAYTPDLYNALGIFIPLIVVNCIILGRAEAFAASHGVGESLLDALGMGLGFTLALSWLGTVRELLGSGSVLGHSFTGGSGILAFILAPGGFLVLGYTILLANKLKKRLKT